MSYKSGYILFKQANELAGSVATKCGVRLHVFLILLRHYVLTNKVYIL